MLQGALCRYTEHVGPAQAPPTAVLLHGILGQRKNMGTFSKMLVEVRSMGAAPQASEAMGPSLASMGDHLLAKSDAPGGVYEGRLPGAPTALGHDGHP